MRLFFSLATMALLLVLGVGPASADITVTDGNSAFTVDPLSSSGMNSWTVDGVNQLYQQWFWTRVGSTAGQQSLDAISVPVVSQGTGAFDNSLSLLYTQTGQFSVEIVYTLLGGNAGSHTADIAETIRINNLSQAALDFHFFQYSDFDLNGVADDQTATMGLGGNSVQQVGNGAVMSETVATPAPTFHEIGIYASTLTSLQSGFTYNLNGANSAGPGDVTWAFQWDKSIAPNGTFLISKDKNIAAAVPEPASILGLGTVLFLIGTKLRRKRA